MLRIKDVLLYYFCTLIIKMNKNMPKEEEQCVQRIRRVLQSRHIKVN